MTLVEESAPPAPPGEPAGRPVIWQTALIAGAFAIVAAGSCQQFLYRVMRPSRGPEWLVDVFALLFLAGMAAASGPLLLVVFRLWRRRQADSRTPAGLLARLCVAGIVLVTVGWIGIAWSLDEPWQRRLLKVALTSAVFVVGLILLVGSVELLVVDGVRRIVERRRTA